MSVIKILRVFSKSLIGWIFCLGEPNNVNNGEDCATVATNGQWNDIPCIGYLYGSICELGKYRNFSIKTVSDKTDF